MKTSRGDVPLASPDCGDICPSLSLNSYCIGKHRQGTLLEKRYALLGLCVGKGCGGF